MSLLEMEDPFDDDLMVDAQPPPLLYHYTDPPGFLGIVDAGGCLRATHHRYLNDAGEVSFGFAAAREVLESFGPQIGSETLAIAEGLIDQFETSDFFLACLSESSHVLSQWREYANACAGYCVGLRAQKRWTGEVGLHAGWSNLLLKCIYDRNELVASLRAAFERRIHWLASVEDSEQKRNKLASALAGKALRYAYMAKHEHFREEREWRVVVYSAAPTATRYRVGKLGLTPYLQTHNLLIHEVWIGPGIGPDAEMARRTLRGFLENRQIKAEVHYWSSPFIRR